MSMNAYRTQPRVIYRCSRGHVHESSALGGYCTTSPCRGIADGATWWDSERKIEAHVVDEANPEYDVMSVGKDTREKETT